MLRHLLGLRGRINGPPYDLCLHRTTHHILTSIPGAGFEPTIPVLQFYDTMHAVDRAITMIGMVELYLRMYADFIEQSTSSEADSHSASQEILRLFMEPEGSLPCLVQPVTGPTPSHPISVRSILILSSHLRLGFRIVTSLDFLQ